MNLPMRVRASRQRARESFCVLSVGCQQKVWHRFKVGLLTLSDPIRTKPSQVCSAACVLVHSRCSSVESQECPSQRLNHYLPWSNRLCVCLLGNICWLVQHCQLMRPHQWGQELCDLCCLVLCLFVVPLSNSLLWSKMKLSRRAFEFISSLFNRAYVSGFCSRW